VWSSILVSAGLGMETTCPCIETQPTINRRRFRCSDIFNPPICPVNHHHHLRTNLHSAYFRTRAIGQLPRILQSDALQCSRYGDPSSPGNINANSGFPPLTNPSTEPTPTVKPSKPIQTGPVSILADSASHSACIS
jgi:hypothetical protein